MTDDLAFIDEWVAAAGASGGDVLLIVPPFASARLPPLAVPLLRAIAQEAGFRASVLYANLGFGRLIGLELYEAIALTADRTLLGERVFAEAAFGTTQQDRGREPLEVRLRRRCEDRGVEVEEPEYDKVVGRAGQWADAVARAVAKCDFKVYGCTSMFEQVSASVALLRRIKDLRPDAVTVIGGANCDGAMAEGICELSDRIDFVFSLDSDLTFPDFLRRVSSGELPRSRIVRGQPLPDLDSLPTPSFADYFDQLRLVFPPCAETTKLLENVDLRLESSRGCWWGQKHHCTFCGVNGQNIGFRQKSPERVIQELELLAAEYPRDLADRKPLRVAMTDNIMPHNYFRTLIPRLRARPLPVRLFYEQKANLSLESVIALKMAGIDSIQPGIESLSTSYLKRMNKGVTAAQNVALLRAAASADVNVAWNLLTHFPRDEVEELQQILGMLPALRHLTPPSGVHPMSIERFSPYFENPQDHGITDLRPVDAYREVFPSHVPPEKISQFFEGRFDCASQRHPEVIRDLKREVKVWRAAWKREPGKRPKLTVQHAFELYGKSTGKEFVLIDTRGLPDTETFLPLNRDEARRVLVKRPLKDSPDCDTARALRRRLAVELDGLFVPLATAEPELLLEFEKQARAEARGQR